MTYGLDEGRRPPRYACGLHGVRYDDNCRTCRAARTDNHTEALERATAALSVAEARASMLRGALIKAGRATGTFIDDTIDDMMLMMVPDEVERVHSMAVRITAAAELALQQRDQAIRERDEAQAERDEAVCELEVAQADRVRAAELEQLFDIQRASEQRAIDAWRLATGRVDTRPDRKNLVIFLMERLAFAGRLLEFWMTDWRPAEESAHFIRGIAGLAWDDMPQPRELQLQRMVAATRPFVEAAAGTAKMWGDKRRMMTLNYSKLTVGHLRELAAAVADVEAKAIAKGDSGHWSEPNLQPGEAAARALRAMGEAWPGTLDRVLGRPRGRRHVVIAEEIIKQLWDAPVPTTTVDDELAARKLRDQP